jgi:peroxiredoxin
LPLVDKDIHQVYRSQGFTALVIHVGEQVAYAQQICTDLKLTFPMVLDVNGSTLDSYSRVGENVALFPLGYLVDKQGVVQGVYTNDEPEQEPFLTKIEELLQQ